MAQPPARVSLLRLVTCEKFPSAVSASVSFRFPLSTFPLAFSFLFYLTFFLRVSRLQFLATLQHFACCPWKGESAGFELTRPSPIHRSPHPFGPAPSSHITNDMSWCVSCSFFLWQNNIEISDALRCVEKTSSFGCGSPGRTLRLRWAALRACVTAGWEESMVGLHGSWHPSKPLFKICQLFNRLMSWQL